MLRRVLVAALAGCGAPSTATTPPAPKPVGGYCPALDLPALVPWKWELFPGCSPPPLQHTFANCDGPCPLPCRIDIEGTGTGPDAPPRGPHVFTYDGRGHLVKAIRDGFPSMACTWSGDRLDRCHDYEAEILDEGAVDGQVYRAIRDDAGVLTAVVSGDARHEIERDPGGRVAAIDDVTFAYDGAGRLVTIGHKWASTSTTIAYDPLGRPATETDEDGDVRSYRYDEQGHLESLELGPMYRLGFGHDDRGRLTTLTSGSAFSSINTYTLSYDCAK